MSRNILVVITAALASLDLISTGASAAQGLIRPFDPSTIQQPRSNYNYTNRPFSYTIQQPRPYYYYYYYPRPFVWRYRRR
jgi:hypothetical protein